MAGIPEEQTPEVLQKYYPGGYFGHDLDGRPIFIEPLGQVDFVGLLHSVKTKEIVKLKRKHCEEAKKLCKEQEEKLGKQLETYSTLILDGEGGGRKHLWKPGLQMYQGLLRMYDEEYPDLRRRIIIINTPSIFPIIFSLIKPFLREATKKKIKVLGSNWEEVIQKYISLDNLPEHYGGTCKDDSGDPKCGQYICYGGKVPESFYVTKNVNKENFISTIIRAGDKFIYDVDISEPNRKIKYQFVTSDYNVGFSIEFLKDDATTIIQDEERKPSHIIMEEGEVICDKLGIYRFTFNNSFSWVRSKELFYMIQTIDL